MNQRIAIASRDNETQPVSVRAKRKLTRRREHGLARRIQHHGDPIARQELIEATLALVYPIARRFEHSGMTREDLIAEGNLGLIRAAERFDPACGTRFHTYARWWIRESIHYAITQHGRLIRLPEYLARRLRAWSRQRNELQHAMQRPPADEDVRRRLGLTKQQAAGVISGFRASVSGSPSCLDRCGRQPDDAPSRRRGEDVVRKLLDCLDSPQKHVLELRYGLGESDSLPRTVRQTADMLHLSPRNVRRLERAALQALRRIIKRTQTKRTQTGRTT